MRVLWTIAALVFAVIGLVSVMGAIYRYSGWLFFFVVLVLLGLGIVPSLYYGRGSHLSGPIQIMPHSASTNQHSSEASNFRVRDRVFHNKFGHGTVVATDGPKLTIEFDDGGVKKVLEGFVVKGNEAPRPD